MGVKKNLARQLDRFEKKASALLEEAKLRGMIAALEKEIKELYVSVGMTMYSMRRQRAVDAGKFEKHFEAIQRKLAEVEEKKERIRQIRECAAAESTPRGQESGAGVLREWPVLPGEKEKAEAEAEDIKAIAVEAKAEAAEDAAAEAKAEAAEDTAAGVKAEDIEDTAAEGVVIEEDPDC